MFVFAPAVARSEGGRSARKLASTIRRPIDVPSLGVCQTASRGHKSCHKNELPPPFSPVKLLQHPKGATALTGGEA